ncbi:hypothetical protein C8J57DRAFT_1724451 [Mycena rebaudengoi]|nr:hypothetical protein C8J57DRAFT_1724451 [Mycena rebaudengoi]
MRGLTALRLRGAPSITCPSWFSGTWAIASLLLGRIFTTYWGALRGCKNWQSSTSVVRTCQSRCAFLCLASKLVLAIEPSRLVVPVISICGPAFRTVVAAALTLRGATSMEFNAIIYGMPSLCHLDYRRSGSGTAESLLEIGSGVYGRFPLLSLVVADSRTRNSGSELAGLLLGGGVFASSFEVVLRIGGLDGGTFVKYSATVENVVDSSQYGLD